MSSTMRRHSFSRDALIETLHTVQESFGYLDKPALKFVADSLRVPMSQAHGVASCSTHADGHLELQVQLAARDGRLLREIRR